MENNFNRIERRYISREDILPQLKAYHDGGGKLLWLYGNKETGKTCLLREFASSVSDCCYVDFMETLNPEYKHLIDEFSKQDEETAFEKTILKLAETYSLIILDHIGLGSTLWEFDRIQEKLYRKKVMLVVVTRARAEMHPLVSMSVFNNSYNVRLKLTDWDLSMCSLVFPGYSAKENVMCYAVHGGKFNLFSLMSTDKTVKENIIALLKVRDLWVRHVFKDTDASKHEQYLKVINAMVNGAESLREISAMTEMPQDEISSILSDLYYYDRNIVKPMVGFDFGLCDIRELDRWELDNQSLYFLFKFVYGYNPENDAEEYYNTYISPYFDKFVEESWQRFYYYGSKKYQVVPGRRRTGGRTVKVNVRLPWDFWKTRSYPVDMTLCGFRLSGGYPEADLLEELKEDGVAFFKFNIKADYAVVTADSER